MFAPLRNWLTPLRLTLPTALCGAAFLAAPSWGQNAPAPADPPAAAKDAKDTAKEAAKDTTKDARETVRGARDDVRDTVKGARDDKRGTREDARDTVKGAREDARDTVKGARDDVRDSRDKVRDAVKDPRDPNDPARDQSRDLRDPQTTREAVRDNRRDDRRDNREVRASFRADGTRSADFGLWLNRDAKEGLVIADVATRGAIAKLGFREGDRIVSVNGRKVTRESDFVTYLFADETRNERVKVIIVRDGKEEVIVVEPTVFVEELSYVDNDPLENFGVIVDDRYNDRIVVWRVVPRSPAYYAGIRAGDVLISLNEHRLTGLQNLVQRLTGIDPGEIKVVVNRGDVPRTFHVDMPQFLPRTERRTTLRPNFDATERREDRIDRRDDRQDRRDDTVVPAPRVPNVPTPGTNPPRVTPPPTTTPAPTPAPGTPTPRPGLFPRRDR